MRPIAALHVLPMFRTSPRTYSLGFRGHPPISRGNPNRPDPANHASHITRLHLTSRGRLKKPGFRRAALLSLLTYAALPATPADIPALRKDPPPLAPQSVRSPESVPSSHGTPARIRSPPRSAFPHGRAPPRRCSATLLLSLRCRLRIPACARSAVPTSAPMPS